MSIGTKNRSSRLAAYSALAGGVVPVASAFAAAYVAGYLFIPAPAGAGIREGALILFLTPHVGVGTAGALAVIARIWTPVVELVPAALFWTRHVAVRHGGSVTAVRPRPGGAAGGFQLGVGPGHFQVGGSPRQRGRRGKRPYEMKS